MAAKTKTAEITAAIPLPSADLIQYRFEQNDQNLKDFRKETRDQFAALSDKLDMMTASFLTKEEAHTLKEEHIKDVAAIWKQFDTYRWYWRAVFSAITLALAGAVIALIIHR